MASVPVEPSTSPLDAKFVRMLAIVAVVLAAIPTLIGFVAAPAQTMYLGYQYATDDHMVYAAWMRQAMDGRFLFDNRFTTDAQPGLTVHLYFLALGWVAKVIGIGLSSNLARLALSFAFVHLLARLIRRLEWSAWASRAAMLLAVFGGGLGFLAWHLFGEAMVLSSPLAGVMLGRLPTDVWQPEGFVFSSMLTNGLFMVSLCLILLSIEAFLAAKDSPKAVLRGAIAFGLLMNIHSYDVLIVATVAIGIALCAGLNRQLDKPWVLRAVGITLGVVPAALWFLYVLRNDAVFQARAATETYSPNFRQVLFGYLPLIVLGLVGIARIPRSASPRNGLIGVGVFSALLLGQFFLAAGAGTGYFLSPAVFGVVFVVALAALVLVRTENAAWNAFLAWALVGTVLIYFPGLFQRKLAMGLALPWGLLAAYGLESLVGSQTKTLRVAIASLVAVVSGTSSLLWLRRELTYIQANVSRTSVHPVFLSPDATAVIAKLDQEPGRKVVVAPPGVPSPLFADQKQETGPTAELTPPMPDLNPIASGLTGAYTIAGHWSETPNYSQRRGDVSAVFYSNVPDDVRLAKLKEWKVTHIIAPIPTAFPGLPLRDFSSFGESIVEGKQFRLIRLR